MQKGNDMDHMIKVVDEFTGIVVAALDPTGIDQSKLREVIETLQRAYGCELTTFYPGE